ncbi:MAG TPA: 50S ribosomal protein L15 [Candidatus Dormibacteraeota bacterium]|nr:50S ribosomal protein L15 [Candidatus Dormibacteraeota bacterium]
MSQQKKPRNHAVEGMLAITDVRPAEGSRPKRVRIGRGHGSGMVKTGGEGGKGQTVRSGGGKGPWFEGGQTPWARRLPHRKGYSQKSRSTKIFRTEYTALNIEALADWDVSVEVTPENLKAAGKVKKLRDGIKVLAGNRKSVQLPAGLRLRDVIFSEPAREALVAAGATIAEA